MRDGRGHVPVSRKVLGHCGFFRIHGSVPVTGAGVVGVEGNCPLDSKDGD